MIVDLTKATLDEFIDVVFGVKGGGGDRLRDPVDPEDWIDLRVDPAHQVLLLADLFRGSAMLHERLPDPQIERGLWRLMGAEFGEYLTACLWDPAVPLELRVSTISEVYTLYDQVLARSPLEAVSFRHPDTTSRRYATIDYMVPDLLVTASRPGATDARDEAAIRDAFFALFRRLLGHSSPIAQYAALHGLGHLVHASGGEVIDAYLAAHPDLPDDARAYAARARSGEIL